MSKPYPLVISAFPGTGKTYITEELRKAGFTVSDSDSSLWPKDNFPANYIEHVSELISDRNHDVIFVSSHDTVRTAMDANDIFYVLVYPCVSLKEEYIRRYTERGSPPEFIELMSSKWDEWIGALDVLEFEMTSKPPRRASTCRLQSRTSTLSSIWFSHRQQFQDDCFKARALALLND